MSIVIEKPGKGDAEETEAILGEIVRTLRKHGCALVQHPNGRGTMLLGRIEGGPQNLLCAIAEVAEIRPEGATWREFKVKDVTQIQ